MLKCFIFTGVVQIKKNMSPKIKKS